MDQQQIVKGPGTCARCGHTLEKPTALVCVQCLAAMNAEASAEPAHEHSHPPEVVTPPRELKLDLACGQHPCDGFVGVDIVGPPATKAKHVVNLMAFPWPWADESVDELHTSHFVEHLPMVYVDAAAIATCRTEIAGLLRRDQTATGKTEIARLLRNDLISGSAPAPCTPSSLVPLGPDYQDLFFAFFDECYRILKPGGTMKVIVPALRNDRAFQDPTHRRFLPPAAFAYLSSEWRKANALDHYNVRCDFSANVIWTIPIELSQRTSEVQGRMVTHEWNHMIDLHVTLKKKELT